MATASHRRAGTVWSSLRLAVILSDLFILIVIPAVLHPLSPEGWAYSAPALAFIEMNCLLTVCGLQLAGAYGRNAMQRPAEAWNASALAAGGAVVALMALAFLSREFDALPRAWLVSSWAIAASCLFVSHLAVTAIVARMMSAGYLRERVAIVCAGPLARMALQQFHAAASPEVSVVGIFDDRKDRVPQDFEGYRIDGDTGTLLSDIHRQGIDRVLVTLPWTAEQRILQLVTKLRQARVRVDLIPHKLICDFPPGVRRIHGVPIMTVADDGVRAKLEWLKRGPDQALRVFRLIGAAPAMLAAVTARLGS